MYFSTRSIIKVLSIFVFCSLLGFASTKSLANNCGFTFNQSDVFTLNIKGKPRKVVSKVSPYLSDVGYSHNAPYGKAKDIAELNADGTGVRTSFTGEKMNFKWGWLVANDGSLACHRSKGNGLIVLKYPDGTEEDINPGITEDNRVCLSKAFYHCRDSDYYD